MSKTNQNLLITLLLSSVLLFSSDIIEITEISNNQKIIDYSQWNGAIRAYNNRLFVENPTSFHEFVISADNEIERLTQLDTQRRALSFLVSEDRLYKFYSENMLNRIYYMMIFDLTSTPMEHILTMEIPYIQHGGYIDSSHLNGDYIFLNNGSSFTSKLNRHTLIFEEQLIGFYGNVEIENNVFVQRIDIYQGPDQPLEHRLKFFDYTLADDENPYGILKSEILFSELYNGKAPGVMKIKDDKLISMSWDFFVVFDISDLDHIYELFHFFTNTYNEICYINGIIVNDCFIASHVDGIDFFDISDMQNLNLLHQESYYLSGSRHSIEHYNGTLYINASDYLVIYDISNNFEQISTYGNNILGHKLDGNYLLENHITSSFIILSSMIDPSSEIYNINTGYDPGEYRVKDFSVKENHLYIIAKVNELEIFQIYFLPNSEIFHHSELNFCPAYIQLYNNFMIFTELPLGGIESNYIYEMVGDNPVYIGQFNDSISLFTDYKDDEYIISYGNNALSYRDIQNPLSIIHSYTLPNSNPYRIYHIKKNIICIEETSGNLYTYYNYSDDLNTLQEFHSFYISNDDFRWLNNYNGYSALNGHFGSSETVLYRVQTDGLFEIGRYDVEGITIGSFLFPEQNKLLVRKNSSIHLYDIEYTSVFTQDKVIPNNKPTLFRNYPNPFNPSTTIACTLQYATSLLIDIYNIKGQRIKTLVNEYKAAGDHIIRWDGKDDNGNAVGSGVYFYRMETDGYVETKKMVLMK